MPSPGPTPGEKGRLRSTGFSLFQCATFLVNYVEEIKAEKFTNEEEGERIENESETDVEI